VRPRFVPAFPLDAARPAASPTLAAAADEKPSADEAVARASKVSGAHANIAHKKWDIFISIAL
jgi:hypothetical protein